ncbi:Putative DASH complex subunit Dad1 protein [Septoria linicola]|uniref:DASH complex subunit DAD1 n=1 Tax=Septoria linicola TaxID=215465 RepID=A0A9Q9AXK4_9PEZI|nr:putative DASH complex subunit Dad1 protein [Septoria linicola]USW56904.1 Putative DASH complex subunit Dad1 protein [Septoria linicola]
MATANGSQEGRAFFEQQRALLIQDVAASMENVLQNINKLNRSLEGVIAVGNEFSQVEGLWSQFENVMAKPAEKTENHDAKEGAEAT